MKAAALLVVVIGLGFGFALNTAGCSSQSICATGAGAGGASGSGGAGGTGGSSNCSSSGGSAGAPTTCGQLTALQACMTAFCKADGAGTPFCTCFTRGYDLGAAPTCGCISFDSAAFCQQAKDNGLDGSSLDCSAATSAIATQCVGVQ
jgi:hypothetical protein